MSLFLDAAPQQGSPLFLFVLIAVMFAFIYFFQWRPNRKRQKEFQNLLASLQVGNEVLLQGGVVGVITKIRQEEDLIQLEIAPGVNIVTKRGFVYQILPAGTVESLNKDTPAKKEAKKDKEAK